MQQLIQQPGISAADKNTFRIFDSLNRGIKMLDAGNINPQRFREFTGTLVVISANNRIGNQHCRADPAGFYHCPDAILCITEPLRVTGKFAVTE
jgi:hypothetical protein